MHDTIPSTIIIPYYVGIGILSFLTIYHIRLSSSFIGNYKDKMYYYYSHLITILPIIMYLYQVLDFYLLDNLTSYNFLKMFYTEWIITTPLILINLGRLINIPLQRYILIILLDIFMILCGYISYIASNNILIYTSYSIGCILYILINGIFIRYINLFKKYQKSYSLNPLYKDILRYRILKMIIWSIIISWSLYPITHILYKKNIISLEASVSIFISIDILTKGIFTNLLLGLREVYRNSDSILGLYTRKLFKVHPLQQTISPHVIEDTKRNININNLKITNIIIDDNVIENIIQNKENNKNNKNKENNKNKISEGVEKTSEKLENKIIELANKENRTENNADITVDSFRKTSIYSSTLKSIDENVIET